MRTHSLLLAVVASSLPAPSLVLAQNFPTGELGELYYAARLDLVPAAQGGPLTVVLDGELDEAAWQRAEFQGWVAAAGDATDPNLAPEEDRDLRWAAVADQDFLYIAWEATDDILQISEQTGCNVWEDDSVEFYIDADNDAGAGCFAAGDCYDTDDVQITIGADNRDNDTLPGCEGAPAECLSFGGVDRGISCTADEIGPAPDMVVGIVRQTDTGWSGEIAIALDVPVGKGADMLPMWNIVPSHGKVIGWNVHYNDDDDTLGTRDHKLMWSNRELEQGESAYRNSAAFAKLMFVDPTRPPPVLVPPVTDLACERQGDGTVRVSWTNPAGITASEIEVSVDGTLVATLPGTATTTTLSEAQVPRDGADHAIGVLNGQTTAECVIIQSPFDDCGGIRFWNLLGAYTGTNGAPGEEAIRRDYMTDGITPELEFIWFPGASIATAFGGAAASAGITPAGVPSVRESRTVSSRINLDAIFGAPDNVMAYAQCYIINAGPERELYAGVSSDDSFQAFLDDLEIGIHNEGRGGLDACTPQNILGPFSLPVGRSSLLLKVFDGCCDWNFAFRFQDESGVAVADGLSVELVPPGVCLAAPVTVTRAVATEELLSIQCVSQPAYSSGTTYDVSLALSAPRPAGGTCAAATAARIVEKVPAGWTPSTPSNNGMINGDTITWNLTAPFPASVTYRVAAAGTASEASFGGTVSDPGSPVSFALGGTRTLAGSHPYTPEGFLKTWLLLGPYRQPGGFGWGPAPSPANMQRDFLTDGMGGTEADIQPEVGDIVRTDFGGASPSPGLAPPATPNGINPGGVPTWKEWRDRDDTIDFNDYYGGDVDLVMMYAFVHLDVADDMVVDIGLGSDDGVQVLLDGEEIHLNSIARPHDGTNAVQDVIMSAAVLQLNPLTRGRHRLMVKVFEGNGGHGFRLRFQEPFTGEPVTEGISLCLDPAPCGQGPEPIAFHRGDTSGEGTINITDGVAIFNWLFLGGSTPGCLEAANANDSAAINITTGVYLLNFLFLGGPRPPSPGPAEDPCGPDPPGSPTDLGCVTYNGC